MYYQILDDSLFILCEDNAPMGGVEKLSIYSARKFQGPQTVNAVIWLIPSHFSPCSSPLLRQITIWLDLLMRKPTCCLWGIVSSHQTFLGIPFNGKYGFYVHTYLGLIVRWPCGSPSRPSLECYIMFLPQRFAKRGAE